MKPLVHKFSVIGGSVAAIQSAIGIPTMSDVAAAPHEKRYMEQPVFSQPAVSWKPAPKEHCESIATFKIPIPATDMKWTPSDRRLFDDLATKEALELITDEERKTLEELTVKRRYTVSPMTPEEYFAETVRNRQIAKVLTELNTLFRLPDAWSRQGKTI